VSKHTHPINALAKEKEDEEKKQSGMQELLVKSRTIVLAGEVNQELAEKIISQLIILDNDSHDPIKVIITSNGGHVDSGYAIHDIMQFVNSPVFSIGAGWVASIAVPILFGAPKENRVALPNTRFLLHQPMGGAGGHLQDIRIEAQEILKIRDRINKLLADETGQPIDKVRQDSDRNFWMSSEEALKYGVISRIVTSAAEIG
jgi:ATP-dependent Clp protease, protease subunit